MTKPVARGAGPQDDRALEHLEVRVDGRSRKFWYRPTSVGDTGVIKQIFQNTDYDLSHFAARARFERYVEEIRSKGQRPFVIDAGANIGASSIYFLSSCPDARVVAIEPERRNCTLLRANCAGLDVALFEGALVGTPGPRFLLDPGLSDWGFRVADRGSYEVPAITLPQVLRDYQRADCALTILKIDIEGGEADLFAADVSWLKGTPLVIIELHDWLFPGEAVARNFLRAISALDFDFIHRGENVFCFNNALLGATGRRGNPAQQRTPARP